MATRFPVEVGDLALAFRGYNYTNLGRTAELMEVKAYREIVREELDRFSKICQEYTNGRVDLIRRVEQRRDVGLEAYAVAISLIAATEVAQIRLLTEIHGIDTTHARLSFGYSLGELVALSHGGVFSVDQMMQIPLALAEDAAELAKSTRLGVLFSRGPLIRETDVKRLCLQITAEGKGTVGISAILSPNTYLLIGQMKTLARFKQVMHRMLPEPAHLRLNSHLWPPMHTPIVWQRNIADRASVMLETLRGGFLPPAPPVLSLVTGDRSYDDHSAREILRKWVDHPQRLWDVLDDTLGANVRGVLHVGPGPNVIPATFKRLGENVLAQTSGSSLSSLGMRAVSGMARRPWLAALLPTKTSLLRAPDVQHIILEDWLLENTPS